MDEQKSDLIFKTLISLTNYKVQKITSKDSYDDFVEAFKETFFFKYLDPKVLLHVKQTI